MDTTHQSARYYDSKLKDGSPVYTRHGSPPIDSSANVPDHVTNALAFLKDVEKISKRAPDIIQELNTLSKVLSDRTIFRPGLDKTQSPREIDLKEDVKRLTQEKDSLQKQLNDARTHTDQKNELTEQERQNKRREELSVLSELQHTKEERDNLQKKLEKINQEKVKLETELSECKQRLSKQIGDKITEGNPDIADLSDKNRPTKLGEQYMELYDNLWTDAFEELEKDKPDKEEEHIRTLYVLLKGIMDFCARQSKDQTEKIIRAVEMKEQSWEMCDQLPESANRIVKALKRETAETLLGELEKKYYSNPGEEFYQLSNLNAKTPALKAFISECIRLCWLMCIQDPPVVLEQTAVSYNSPFNKNRYKPYTKSGSCIDFLVWPALLLHENGPVLAKGVAQGLGEPLKSVEISVSDQIHQETTTRPERSHSTVGRNPKLPSEGTMGRLYESRQGQHSDQEYATHSTTRKNPNVPTSVTPLTQQFPHGTDKACGKDEKKRTETVKPLDKFEMDKLVDGLLQAGTHPKSSKEVERTTFEDNSGSQYGPETFQTRSDKYSDF